MNGRPAKGRKPTKKESSLSSARLSKANNWIVMVRGNHDDPSYFNKEKIKHERCRTIPDYSIIQACGHNILCIGGAVSIDRNYRKKHDAKYHLSGTASYWADEMTKSR